jgi:hypothetical protein
MYIIFDPYFVVLGNAINMFNKLQTSILLGVSSGIIKTMVHMNWNIYGRLYLIIMCPNFVVELYICY